METVSHWVDVDVEQSTAQGMLVLFVLGALIVFIRSRGKPPLP